MNAMHISRQNFIAAERSEKIRRALRHKVRSYSDVVYVNGEIFSLIIHSYYQKKKEKRFQSLEGSFCSTWTGWSVALIRHSGANQL